MSTDLELRPQHQDGMDLIRAALQSEGTPSEKAALVKELVGLQQSMIRFEWEREERQYRIDFDSALNRCQSAVGRIAPNQKRNDTNSWWADYAQLDRVLRPIYTAEGFSIGYSEVAPLQPGKVRIRGKLSRMGISTEFFGEITPSTTGPKGNAMATATDADAIAQSRAKRYILIDIFNIAVGIDKIEKEGVPEETLSPWLEKLSTACDTAELNRVSLEAIKAVRGDTAAVQKIGQAKNSRIKEIREANNA
jgi:hypothetical protein